MSEKQEQEEEGQDRTGQQPQWCSLLLRKEKEKIGPGRLPESWVNHQKIAGTTWVCTNTGTLSVPISSPQLSLTVQEVQAGMARHVARLRVQKWQE